MSLNTASHSTLGYRRWLDGLRAIAILGVFVHHIQHLIYKGGPIFGWLFLPFGSLGVDIFFVLSGFLITSLLLEEYQSSETINLKHFYIRRALRLLPALLILLAFTILFAILVLPKEEARWTMDLSVIALFYGTNWVFAMGGPGSDWLGHLWSLAVEEQFYLVWPVALLILLRLRIAKQSIALLTLILVGGICVYRVCMVSPMVAPTRIYAGTDTRADSILIGCLVAMAVSWHMLRLTAFTISVVKIAGLLSAIAAIAFLLDIWGIARNTLYETGFTFFAVAVGVFIFRVMVISAERYVRFLESRYLVWIGKLSYSLYLWHFFAINITLKLQIPRAVCALISVTIAFGFAISSYYIVELRFLRLKSRFTATTPRETSTHAERKVDDASYQPIEV